MTPYTKASQALREAMIAAIQDDKFDNSILIELWRHFLGVQAIAEKLKKTDSPISTFTIPDNSSSGKDCIQFPSSYSYENLRDDLISLD